MGKAARWLRSLLGGSGGKKDKEQGREQRRPSAPNVPPPTGDRKRWSFCKSSRDSSSEPDPSAAPPASGNAAIARAAEAAWLKSLYKDTEREQSKQAIAVAAATAAAADAAVAAAHAAVEVVRLTSQGPASTAFPGAFVAAAVKIQTAFRGFLAKKALRALKALVKLQALVRGYLVRKQAAATLQSMQALVRAQASIRAARSLAAALPHLRVNNHPSPLRPRYSLQERYTTTDDTRSDHSSVAAYYSRRLSASVESLPCYDRSPKIVEMDTGRPKSRSSSLRTSPPVASEADAGENCCAYSYSVSSPLPPCHHNQLPGAPPRISARHFPDPEWFEKARPATAQSTPRYSSLAPVTPTKSACGGGYSNSPSSSLNCPSYMSSTRSSVAKVRSQSAPKQRPEEVTGGIVRKRVPLSEVIILQEARASLSGVGVPRPCNRPAHAQEEAFNFKKAVVSRFDRSSEPADRDRDLFLQKGW